MVVTRAIWFVVSLPFRGFFWFVWQCQLAGYKIAAWLQRRFGRRNAALIFCVLVAVTGSVMVLAPSRRGGPLLGMIIVAASVGIAIWALRTLPTDRSAAPMPDAYPYDPAEWRLSWPPVIVVGVTTGQLRWRLSTRRLCSNVR